MYQLQMPSLLLWNPLQSRLQDSEKNDFQLLKWLKVRRPKNWDFTRYDCILQHLEHLLNLTFKFVTTSWMPKRVT